jgi:hypothetical protein
MTARDPASRIHFGAQECRPHGELHRFGLSRAQRGVRPLIDVTAIAGARAHRRMDDRWQDLYARHPGVTLFPSPGWINGWAGQGKDATPLLLLAHGERAGISLHAAEMLRAARYTAGLGPAPCTGPALQRVPSLSEQIRGSEITDLGSQAYQLAGPGARAAESGSPGESERVVVDEGLRRVAVSCAAARSSVPHDSRGAAPAAAIKASASRGSSRSAASAAQTSLSFPPRTR